MESDDEFGYDLSLADEQLLAALADGAPSHHPALSPLDEPDLVAANHDNAAPNPVRSSQKGANTTALRAVGRTHSVDALVQATQPQSAPSVVPADNVQYPDRKSYYKFRTVVRWRTRQS